MNITVPPEVEEFFRRHEPEAESDISAIRTAIAEGSCRFEIPKHFADGDQLLDVYSVRSQHLARYDSPHAQRLRSESELLCRRLASTGAKRCRLWSFDYQDGRGVAFFENADDGRLLGTFHTVDRRKVTADAWRRLWGEESDNSD